MKLFDERAKPYTTNHLSSTQPLHIQPITDKNGLEKAYSRDSKLYTHGDTLYIAGTHSFGDFLDWPKVPLDQVENTKRYQKTLEVLKVNPDIKNVVGHSLGGSVAMQLQQDFPDRKFKSNVYGTPMIGWKAADNRFRNVFDPVSILDRGAQKSVNYGLNPHHYSNFDNNKVSDNAFPTYTYTTTNGAS